MPKAIDMTGQKIGKLELKERKREKNRTYYKCQCSCGSEPFWVRADSFNKEKGTISCGCFAKERAIDIKDQEFYFLKAIEKTDERDKHNGSVIWKCKCKCGNIKKVSSAHLISGRVRSCGCLGEKAIMDNLQKAIKKNLEENLVEGTSIYAISNVKPRADNTSGVPGVTWVKNRNKWIARITFKQKIYNLGTYSDKDEAIKVRKEAEEKMFGSFLDWYYEEIKNKRKRSKKEESME